MLSTLLVILFVWLLVKAAGLAFKVAWGAAKIAAMVLFVLACPALIVLLLFTGGALLLIPVAMIAAAFGLLRACV